MRSLSPEEAELWDRVAATIRPLARGRAAEAAERPKQDRASQIASKPSWIAVAASRSKSSPIGEKTLDGSWDKRLRSGSLDPDRILDLHGMNLDRAWAAIDLTLEQAIGHGERLVLLITGHHRLGEPPVARGRIRAAVHDWLAASRHAGHIAAVRTAHRRHGGGGSLYLVLRRQRRPR